MSEQAANAFFLTLTTATLSTLLILPPGLFIAWILARKKFPMKSIVETLVSLPLLMPPVATGLVLLKLIGRRGVLGTLFYELSGADIVFTWRAVVAAMAVMSFPFVVRTGRVAFEEIDPRLEQVARTLGCGAWKTFRKITFPLAIRGIIAGTALAFGRAIGEFGATVIVAGNIPGKTATLSVSIFYLIQLGRDSEAFRLVLLSLVPCFFALWLSEYSLRNRKYA